MTTDPTRWALAVPLTSARAIGADRTRCVLVALAQYADAEGIAWPGRTTLADDVSGITERDVRNALDVLAAAGVISPTAPPKRGRPTRWRLNWDAVPQPIRRPRPSEPAAAPSAPEMAGIPANSEPVEMAGIPANSSTPEMAGEMAGRLAGIPAMKRTEENGTPTPKGVGVEFSIERANAAAPAALRSGSAPLPQPLDAATDRLRMAINFAIPMPEFEYLEDWARIASNDPTERLYTPGAPAGALVLDRLALAVVDGAVDEAELRALYSATLVDLQRTAAARGWICGDVIDVLRSSSAVDPWTQRLEIRECEPAEPGMPRLHTLSEPIHHEEPSTEGAPQ